MNQPKVAKETKNTIRVEFDRTPLLERLKAKFISLFFLKKVVWFVFRLVLLLGISYIVLFPFFSKIAGSFMAREDFIDATVRLIPKHFTLDIYKAIWIDNDYVEALKNTFFLSFFTAVLQMFSCCLVAYGLAKFKFRGNKLIFLLVIFTMIVPRETLYSAFKRGFVNFDVFGIMGLLSRIGILPETFSEGVNLMNTHWPMLLLSIGCLAFKNGLYIFLLRQFFRGVPDELEESAYMDGSGVFRTFIQIILPLSIPMMITVFLFAFCWQWTDQFYSNLFYTTKDIYLMPKIVVEIPESLNTDYAGQILYETAIRNTCGIMIIAPLIVLYAFCQRFLVQGIERSGLTAD